jgi:hypothetical protein
MVSWKFDFRRVGIGLLFATAASVTVILLGQLAGLSESAAERVSTILFFPVFLGACNAPRRGSAA